MIKIKIVIQTKSRHGKIFISNRLGRSDRYDVNLTVEEN